MKIYFLILITTLINGINVYAQKPGVDTSTFSTWPEWGAFPLISNDGNYVTYTLQNQPIGGNTFVIQSTKSHWKVELQNVGEYPISFTEDSKKIIFVKNDTLHILRLGSSTINYIPHVSVFKLQKQGLSELLVYYADFPKRCLILRDLKTGKEKLFADVTEYLFSQDGLKLILKTTLEENNNENQSLSWINLLNERSSVIAKRAKINKFIFNVSENKIAFATPDDSSGNSFWIYDTTNEKLKLLLDNKIAKIDSGLVLDDIQSFSKDGNQLFFSLKEIERKSAKPGAIMVDVWSYFDKTLQSQQLDEVGNNHCYKAVINIENQHIIRLEQRNERVVGQAIDNHLILSSSDGGSGESNWNVSSQNNIILISAKTGKRALIKEDFPPDYINISPLGKYVIFFDRQRKNYFTYEIATGILRNVTQNIATVWTKYKAESRSYDSPTVSSPAGWLVNDATVLLYDQNDIWKVDPTGKKHPINLTNGYGKAHDIFFELLNINNGKTTLGEKLLLSAFNRTTKENGFFSKEIEKSGDPKLLSLGNHFYYAKYATPGLIGSFNFLPIKARDADTYMIRRQSATEFPNFFVTRDFKALRSLTNVHPEKKYNWLTSELHSWTLPSSGIEQGILYKPENFNPKKKYPIILTYYEIKSNSLNCYLYPKGSGDAFNIPWFVANGYLVFQPDIHFQVGEAGQSSYNSVTSAVSYLSKFPYIDTKKIGIQGTSFGGYQTNYLITHSNIFAAACTTVGVSNLISLYGSLSDIMNGSEFSSYSETGQQRMGASLWQSPDLYIKNSPIFNVDQVTTPVLMMQNRKDALGFVQGVGFFTAFRRLGKRAWMLQYDDGGHGLAGKSDLDFSIRLKQFFDHYLKGVAAPLWMLDGIPAREKGLQDGLQLDTLGRTPIISPLLTKEERIKIEASSKIPFKEKIKNLMQK